MTARDALQMSLNIPAVAVLEQVGPLAFTLSLQNAGARISPSPKGARPACRWRWAAWASAWPTSPCFMPASPKAAKRGACAYLSNAPQPAGHRLFGPVAAYYLRGILDGVSLPDGWAMGQGLKRSRTIGFKTGTSYGYRDAWSVGFSNDYTVACGWAAPTARRGPTGWGAMSPRRCC